MTNDTKPMPPGCASPPDVQPLKVGGRLGVHARQAALQRLQRVNLAPLLRGGDGKLAAHLRGEGLRLHEADSEQQQLADKAYNRGT